MKLMKWLFQPVHLLLLLIIAALYINRDIVFTGGENSLNAQQLLSRVDGIVTEIRDSETPAADSADAVGDDVTNLAQRSPADSGSDETASQADKPRGAATTAIADQPDDIVGSMSEDMRGSDDVPVMPIPMPASQAPSPVDEAMPGTIESLSPLVPATGEQGLQPSQQITDVRSAKERTEVFAAMPSLEIWRTARRAFWGGDSTAAVTYYRQLIAIQPDNYDAYGELGNVLLSLGDVDGAVAAYMQATRLIKRAGYPQVAWQLLQQIGRLSPEQANALYFELSDR